MGFSRELERLAEECPQLLGLRPRSAYIDSLTPYAIFNSTALGIQTPRRFLVRNTRLPRFRYPHGLCGISKVQGSARIESE